MAWLKTKNAAKYVDFSPRTLRSLVSAGEIKPAIIRGKYYFDTESLDRFMNSRKGFEGSIDSLVSEIVGDMT